jgi:hypothetical protein
MVQMISKKYAKYATYRKLIYERKGLGGVLQIWQEPDGSYTQVINTGDHISTYKCSKDRNKIKCGPLLLDLKSKKKIIKPVNVQKEAEKQLPLTDRLLLKADKHLQHFKLSYGSIVIQPVLKWALIGALSYLTFLFVKKQIEEQ